jgi:FkbM family methyltransferase
MIINFFDIYKKYNRPIQGIIHIGAHEGREIPEYSKNGISKLVMFEPQKKVFSILKETTLKYPDINFTLHNVALGNQVGQIQLNTNVNNAGMSSSILKPKEHLTAHPWCLFSGTETVDINMLDNYLEETVGCNFLNIDVQGYELEVFSGGRKTLDQIDYINSEVNTKYLYENNALINELDDFLKDFVRVETKIFEQWGWGDAFYVRKTLL